MSDLVRHSRDPKRPQEPLEAHVHAPSQQVPCLTHLAELIRTRTRLARQLCHSDRLKMRVGIRKHQIALLDLTQGFVKVILGTVLFPLRAPYIALSDLVVESLTMIDPPVAHCDQ